MAEQQPIQTRFDRAINWLSPQWATKRMAWRGVQASYNGGLSTRLSSGYSRQSGQTYGTSVDRRQLASARDRAYQAYDNNPVASTLVDTETDNVIGDGLNYQPTSSSPEWNKEAKDRYYRWIDEADIRQMRGGADLQRELWTQSRIAGDIGWILVARGAESRIQIVPAENIATPYSTYNPNIIDGIEFDALGAPRVFHVLTWDETGKQTFTPIPARDFVYLPHLTKPNQARGATCYLRIFRQLENLDEYIDGVALAARLATVFGLVFKQENAGKVVNGLDSIVNSQGNPQRAITLENGMVKYIGTKDEVAQVQATQPMQQTPDFIRAMMRLIGMPFGMALEVFAKDMSTCNFASARIGLLPFYRLCRTHATCRFGPRWSRTIRWWLSREAQRANGDPKRWVNAFPADYWNHELLPNSWEYTDPVSGAQSDQIQIDMGIKSPQMVIAERGRDVQLIIDERQQWQEKTAGLPETRSTMTRDAVQAVTAVDADGNPLASGDSAPLNGIQIASAMEVLSKVTEKLTDTATAIELLSRLNIAPDKAIAMVTAAANRTGISAGDRTFQREMLKILATNPAARDAIYEGTDMEDLILQAGLPVEKGYVFPHIPVTAAAGPLVSGAVIYDPEGDIVGGDAENELPVETEDIPNEETDVAH